MPSVLGADACRNGWIGVVWRPSRPPRVVWGHDFAQVVSRAGGVEAVAVDIPIGLPLDSAREAERLARGRVGRLSSSVFPVPVQAVLREDDWATANQVQRAVAGSGLSRQSHALLPKIRDVHDFLAKDPDIPVLEAHPEVCFAAMNDGPLSTRKKSWQGSLARLALLRHEGLVLGEATRSEHSGDAVAGLDDVIDAAACAWTARRYAADLAERLPAQPRGELAPAIWV